MKNIFCTLLLFGSTYLVHSQSLYLLDEKFGYKDIRLETLKSDMLDKIWDCTPDGHCLISGAKYRKINDVNIKNIFVKFHQNKLMVIMLMIEGKDNVDDLLEIYKTAYGKANNYNQDEMEVMWKANKSFLDFNIDVDKDGKVSALVMIGSNELLNNNNMSDLKKSIDDL